MRDEKLLPQYLEILPCPLCGGVSFYRDSTNFDDYIYCNVCQLQLEPAGGYTKETLIEQWNTRTPSLDWIVTRAVELGRVDDERQFKNIYGQTCWDKEYKKTPEEILEQIKKELGEI